MKILRRLLFIPFVLLWPIGYLIWGDNYMSTNFFDE